ncbi:AraC family transcriptional regulator, activator of mtrCDE [Luteibacter sp. UNC138MFCol5.1]|uniref:cupin domain-containing protein n=1 Tax=Luteibacter sp. UNC138MFCol5.1 TaxID=1502774 RepID=UPI0008D171DF|nr:AraC family transcriptional regulator [Luteibacter sp. UNC138MFCol5.1]SEO95200.1 AraC family transcriptional regulator, activator of mtrCDE [Luteibacter sp. UNC138MFCol5.1]
MDALTRLLDLANVQGVLDVRCYLAGGFSVEHDIALAGEAPFHLVLSGEGIMELPGRVMVPMSAGDLIVLPRGTSHRVHDGGPRSAAVPVHVDRQGPLDIKRNTLGPADLDLLCGRFTFAPDAARLAFDALPDVLHVKVSEQHGAAALDAVVAMFRSEVERMEPGALAVVTSLSRTLLVFALRAQLREGQLPPSLLSLLGDARLGRAVLAMLRDPAREWTVETLAREAAMSRATFARHFEARGRIAPHEVLTLLRMHLAGDLLRRGDLTAGAVADRVGYRSESAFGKAFVRVMGVTPARYRRDHLHPPPVEAT